MEEFIRRFAINEDRSVILVGLLDYREALHSIRITEGFQWINGSFVEHIEARESRPPRDIDVVTFYKLPESVMNEHIHLFESEETTTLYKVDAHGVALDAPMTQEHVEYVAFWQNVWTHRIDGTPKGMVHIPLDPREDPPARETLESLMSERGWI